MMMEFNMRGVIIMAVVFCFSIVPVFTQLSAAADIDEILKGIKGRYGKTKDMKGAFVQKTMVKTLNRAQVKTGTVWFKRPDKMRWNYVKPEKQQLITDGNTLWIYQVEQKVVFMKQLDVNNSTVVPMKILSGEINANTQFHAKVLKVADGVALLELKPRRHGGYEKAVLHVSLADFDIRRIDIFDLYGNITELTINDVVFDNKLTDGFFVYTPIPGVKVEAPPVM